MTIAAISDAFISGSSNAGIVATTGGAGASFRVSVTRSTVSNGQYGILSSGPAGSVLTVSESMVTKNSYGFYREGAETFESLGNNAVRQNALKFLPKRRNIACHCIPDDIVVHSHVIVD